MGKKIKKYAKVQDFSKRKEEEASMKESPFSSIVLKEKTEEPKKKQNNIKDGRKKASEVVQGYDPNASFADILSNFERTGNPYALPKKKVQSTPLSFGDILDKWEGKDKKKKEVKETKKSTYKATKSFADILSEYEGKPAQTHNEAVIDEEVDIILEKEEERKDESPLFKKESDEELRSPEASWSIYGNNESFVRKEEEKEPPLDEKGEDKKEEKKSEKRSTYKATKDFGEILKGFYSKEKEIGPESSDEKVEEKREEVMDELSLFKKESMDEGRNPEASWSVYGNNESFVRKEEKKEISSEEKKEERKSYQKRSPEYKGKKEFSAILSSFNEKKKEREDIKTFENIIKEKGDIPEKREYTISQLRTMMPQATLDLHGKTEAEALELVKTFLSDCRAHKIRKISIITGKGLHSEGGVGVLRDSVSSFLDSAPGISEKGNAPLQYGGSGAFWIILKKES